MYGLVNKGVQDLVTSQFGQEKWEQIKEKAGVKVQDFAPLEAYDDSITYSLVGAASEVLGLSPEQILKVYGKFWVLFTAKSGYGELMDLFGSNLVDCLLNLNLMHGRMGAMMPQLKPPRFSVTLLSDDRKKLKLEYVSSRQGLAPMVAGLLEGLAEKFNTEIDVKHAPKSETQSTDIFFITLK